MILINEKNLKKEIESILHKKAEKQIKKIFKMIEKKGIEEEVKLFAIELFFDDYLEAMLFTMEDEYEEVFQEEHHKKFIGSTELITSISFEKIMRKIDILYDEKKEEEANKLYDFINDTVLVSCAEMIKKYAEKIDIRMYVYYHDTVDAIDIKTGETILLYEDNGLNYPAI